MLEVEILISQVNENLFLSPVLSDRWLCAVGAVSEAPFLYNGGRLTVRFRWHTLCTCYTSNLRFGSTVRKQHVVLET